MLFRSNRPAKQKAVDFGNYEILVNPYPIFPEHFTIPRKDHIDQQIKPFFSDMLQLAKALDNYLIFYNGPKCGASAPDHMHFQAGTKDFLPLINDYKRLKETHANLVVTTEKMQIYTFEGYLRTVLCIESTDIESAKDSFQKLYDFFQNQPFPTTISTSSILPLFSQNREQKLNNELGKEVEPMMNIVCNYQSGKWFTFLLPRKAFRPWQYSAESNEQLLVSPATVEMCGIFITPIEKHFERITKKDIENILHQIS